MLPLLPMNLNICWWQHCGEVKGVAQGQCLSSFFLHLNCEIVGWLLKLVIPLIPYLGNWDSISYHGGDERMG